MTTRTFGNRKRRNEGRWLLVGVLMVTTAMVMIPKAEAQDAGIAQWGWRTFIGNHAFAAQTGNINGGERQMPDPAG